MEKICEVCGKEYETSQPNQKVCSAECQKKKNAAYQKLYREVYHDELLEKARKNKNTPKLKKICEYCGREFVTSRPTRKTCSPECSMINKHKRSKANQYVHNWMHEESLSWDFEKVFEAYDEGKINYQQLCQLEAYRVEQLGYLGGC